MSTLTIARLRVRLCDIEPVIWRTFEVALTESLDALHDIIQAVMGWDDCHLWHFEAEGRRYGRPDPYWPDLKLNAAASMTLGVLVKRGVSQLCYTYDLGDDWRHLITVEAIEPATTGMAYPRFVAGARQAPPEDVGGVPGYEAFLAAIGDPTHDEHERLREWHGAPYDPDDIDQARIERGLKATSARQAPRPGSRVRKPIVH